LIAVNPYDLAADIPWAAQDWEVGTWIDPRTGTEKQTVTYWLRENCGIAQPETGCLAGQLTWKDYVFSCWYNYAFDDDWQWSSFMDLNHIEILADGGIKVYFDDISMWFVYSPIYPLLGPHDVLEPLLTLTNTATFTGADLVESPPGYFEYSFTVDKVIEVVSATANGLPIYEGIDYYIRAGYDTFLHNVFVPMRAFAPGDVIVIDYVYPIAGGAGGTYIGGNLGYDWTDTMYAYGYMYPVAISTTSAALNRNPYFHMETVPKGEIDFRWNYVAGPKPRDGFFKIDILDVVKCTGAYCTRGDGVFNPVYLPGADLDDTDVCHIGILDLVTITGKYANTFGRRTTFYSTHGWNYAGTHKLPDYQGTFVIDYVRNAVVTAADANGVFTVVKSDPSKNAEASGWFTNTLGYKERWSVCCQGSGSWHTWIYAGEYTLPDYASGFTISDQSHADTTAPDTNLGKAGMQFTVAKLKNEGYAYGTYVNTDGQTEHWKVVFK
jgi:hypothetical protein